MNHSKHSHAQRMVALLVMTAILCQQASADVVQWNVPAGSWFNPNNWVPNVIPSSDDDIFIGNLPGVQNGLVFMGGGTLNWGYGDLHLSNGMTLDLNGTELVSFDDAWLTGLGTRLIVRPQPAGPNQQDFQGVLHIGEFAELQLMDGVEIRIFTGSVSSGKISGDGHVVVSSLNTFVNNGFIEPSDNGGITMTYGEFTSDLDADLDGTTGEGVLQLSDAFSTLVINAGSLTDSFGGTIIMAAGTVLTMNVIDGWTADSNSQINIGGSDNLAAASLIDGEEFTFGGSMSVADHEAHLRVLAPTILTETAEIAINTTGWVEWDGETTVNGGVYTLNQDAYMDFYGPATVKGGVFNTFSNSLGDGSVNFHNETTWNGNVAINGVARQDGDADVTGSTIIDAGVFDMDGIGGGTAWDILANFVLNAESIDSTPGDRFNGTINVAGGFLPKLVVNLSNSDANWGMDGTMNLSGVSQLFETRLSGSPVDVEGDVSIDGNVSITANVTFSDTAGGATLNLGTDGAVLRMMGETVVREGVTILGDGTLQNGLTGMMILDDGVSLGNVALVNLGLLELAEGPGSASMDYFENGSTGTWVVEIRGYAPGTEHDELIISGSGALLDGLLEIELPGVAGEHFMPQIGDEFTILTTLSGVNGTFTNAPVTTVGGQVYEWSVQYSGNNVLVRLDDVTGLSLPMPADPPNDRRKNRYISFQPGNAGELVKLKVTLTDSLPHPALVGSSWWVQQPVPPGSPLLPTRECMAFLGPEETAAEIDWEASGCQTLHVTGCPIEPTSEYAVRAVAGIDESATLAVATILQPADNRFWGDTIGFFNGVEWTPPNLTVNIDDAVVGIKTWQGGPVVAPIPGSNIAHLSVVDVAPGNIDAVVNINDVFMVILAFQGEDYPFGPADADGNCP